MELFRNIRNNARRNRIRKRFFAVSSVTNLHDYLITSECDEDFQIDYVNHFQQHIDHFLALYFNSPDKKQLLHDVVEGLSPWQQGKFISMLYLHGHSFERETWLPEIADDIYTGLPDATAQAEFNTALEHTDPEHIILTESGPVISVTRYYSPVIPFLAAQPLTTDEI